MIAEIQNAGADSYVLLQLANRRFALPSTIVSELAPPVRLHTFPHTSPLCFWSDRAPRAGSCRFTTSRAYCWAEVRPFTAFT